MNTTPLAVERHEREGRDVICVRGELDLTNAGQLEHALAEGPGHAVVLDLGHLTFIDSAGIRAIDRAHRRRLEAGGSLIAVAPGDSRAASILRVAGFSADFVVGSLDQAVHQSSPDA